jgi:hypothetical protein
MEEEYEDTKGIIRIRKSKDRQHNGQTKKEKQLPTNVNFPFICSKIPATPAYGVYISQLIRYSRACGSYHAFFDRGLLLTRKLLNQGMLLIKSSFRKFYDRQHDLVNRYGISLSQMIMDMFHLL